MARTLTIHDEELGATASVRVEHTPAGPLVTAVHFDADTGRGISADALRLIEALGLRLPDTAPPAVPQGKTRARKPPAPRRGRRPARDLQAAAPQAQLPAAEALQPGDAQPGDAQPPAPSLQPPAVPQPRRGVARPDPQRLAELFARHHGVMTAMAAELGVAPNTVAAWLRKTREAGHRITLGASS
jgi:hypothetical protein